MVRILLRCKHHHLYYFKVGLDMLDTKNTYHAASEVVPYMYRNLEKSN